MTARSGARNGKRGRVDHCRARMSAKSCRSVVGDAHTGPTHFAVGGHAAPSRRKRSAAPTTKHEQEDTRDERAGLPLTSSRFAPGFSGGASRRIAVRPVGCRGRRTRAERRSRSSHVFPRLGKTHVPPASCGVYAGPRSASQQICLLVICYFSPQSFPQETGAAGAAEARHAAICRLFRPQNDGVPVWCG